MEVGESLDRTVAEANARVATGRKWRAVEVQKAMGRLQHQEVVGRVKTGWAGLGWSDPPILWSKANRKERKDLVVAEVTRVEQEELRVKSVDKLGGCRESSNQLGRLLEAATSSTQFPH